jgi:hypothetical protein
MAIQHVDREGIPPEAKRIGPTIIREFMAG